MDGYEWYYVQDGDREGPVSDDVLREMVRSNQLAPATLVWREGMPEWREAAAALSGTESTPPPPHRFASDARPVSTAIFGVLSIIFGTMGLLCSPLGIAGIFVQPDASQFAPSGIVLAWLVIGVIIGMVCGVAQIVLGIGLFKLKSWGRLGLLYYGIFAVVWGLLSIPITIWIMSSGSLGIDNSAPGAAAGGMIGGLCGGLISLIYPLLLIIFMTRPNVKAACTK
ncbi:MAG: DUF4339 domain-containing protein [Candidatus Hydrogenedentes bacterium]|nr:DUF4339 domain-containing protein [Candidatus Hydrogenedentota bacterium]